MPKAGLGLWTSVSIPAGALVCEFTGKLTFAQDSKYKYRGKFPRSKLWDDRHTWPIRDQREEAAIDASREQSDEGAVQQAAKRVLDTWQSWFVLAFDAASCGSGAGFVNSVYWKETYDSDANANDHVRLDCDTYKKALAERDQLKAQRADLAKDMQKNRRRVSDIDGNLEEMKEANGGHELQTPNVQAVLMYDHGNGQPRLFWKATRFISRCDELLCLVYFIDEIIGMPPTINWPQPNQEAAKKRKRPQ